nr:PrsW family glutamic-type intramembrane protease [Patescibacteria group bacterium]
MISFTIVILAVAISFLVALFWLGIIHYNTEFLKWENNNIFSLVIGGIAAVGIAGSLQFIFIEDNYFSRLDPGNLLENSLFFYIAIAALSEEFFKGVVVWWGIKKIMVRTAKDGIVIGMIVGLAFAVAENGIYFANKIDSSSIESIFNLILARTIFSSTAHMLFSGIIGFFIAKGIILRKSFAKLLLFLVGLFFAVLIHIMFN